jgi:HEAT repeat protein
MRRVPMLIAVLSLLTGCCSDEKARLWQQKLYSSSSSERGDGAEGLAYCGKKAESAVPKLAQLLYDENTGVQSMAAFALRRIDTPAARRALERASSSRR